MYAGRRREKGHQRRGVSERKARRQPTITEAIRQNRTPDVSRQGLGFLATEPCLAKNRMAPMEHELAHGSARPSFRYQSNQIRPHLRSDRRWTSPGVKTDLVIPRATGTNWFWVQVQGGRSSVVHLLIPSPQFWPVAPQGCATTDMQVGRSASNVGGRFGSVASNEIGHKSGVSPPPVRPQRQSDGP